MKNRGVKMKISLLLIVLLNIVGCKQMDNKKAEQAKNISLTLKISKPNKKGHFEKIYLTLKNLSDQDRFFILPAPLKENTEKIAFPILGLETQYNNEKAEVFVYTNFDLKQKISSKNILIPKHGEITEEYNTTMFWRWGPCGPDRWGSFEKYFKEGENEISVKIKLTFDENIYIESNVVKMKCSFQKWLFDN
jgi:hypothetical protein